MKRLTIVLLSMFAGLLSGCFHLDNPPERRISVTFVRDDTGAPLAGAKVWFRSGRKYFAFPPWENFGIDAAGTTDKDGKLSIAARLNPKVEVIVYDQEFYQRFELPPFSESNRIEGVLWRVREKSPTRR